jgi:serine/threonine-protein kinase
MGSPLAALAAVDAERHPRPAHHHPTLWAEPVDVVDLGGDVGGGGYGDEGYDDGGEGDDDLDYDYFGRPSRRSARAARRAQRPRRRGRVAVVLLLVLALLGGGGYAGWWYLVRIPSHTVPSYVGAASGAAEQNASSNGWQVATTSEHALDSVVGQVLRQTPAAGTELEERSTITLVVSLGPPPVAVPAGLVGVSLDDAGRVLAEARLNVGEVTRRYDEVVPLGTVIALADGTPSEVTSGGSVGLVVSAGPEPRVIPSGLVGGTADDAKAALAALGLQPVAEEEFSETVPKGEVISVSPVEGATADRGDPVEVVVSKGPPMVKVPDVTGMSVVEAGNELEAVGLVVSGTQGSPTKPVASTTPAAGTQVRKGSSVTIITHP